jgi:hypothetical protein
VAIGKAPEHEIRRQGKRTDKKPDATDLQLRRNCDEVKRNRTRFAPLLMKETAPVRRAIGPQFAGIAHDLGELFRGIFHQFGSRVL